MPLSALRHPLTLLAVVAAALTLASVRFDGDDRTTVVTTTDTIPASFDTIGARVDTSPATMVVRNAGGERMVPHTLISELRIDPAADGLPTFGAIDDVAARPDGGVYLWDRTTAAIRQYDADGRLVRQVGRHGSGPGEYDDVGGMVLVDGMLVILDRTTNRVSVFDSAGAFHLAWPVPAQAAGFGALHRRTSTSFYVRQRLGDTVVAYGVSTDVGHVAYRWDGTLAGDTVPLPSFPDERRFTLQTATANRYVVRDLPFATQLTVALSPRGDLVAGTGSAYRLDVLRRHTIPLQVERDIAAVPVTLGERTDSARAATADMKSVDPSWRWHGPAITHSKPFFRRVLFDDTGRIWVERALPSVRERPTESAAVQSEGKPAVVWREDLTYDVFDHSGRLAAVVTPPPMSRIVQVAGDVVWGIETAGDAAPVAVRWRLVPPR